MSSGATTATVAIPSPRQARKTRSAISPRFATRSLRISGSLDAFLDGQRPLPVLPAFVSVLKIPGGGFGGGAGGFLGVGVMESV